MWDICPKFLTPVLVLHRNKTVKYMFSLCTKLWTAPSSSPAIFFACHGMRMLTWATAKAWWNKSTDPMVLGSPWICRSGSRPFRFVWSYWPSGDSLENLNLLVCVSVLTAHLWTESLMLCQWSWPGIVWQQVYGSCVQQVGRAFLDLFSFPCRSWYPFGKQELIWILDIPHTSS